MKKLFLTLALIFAPSLVMAQCTGVFPANTLCGNLSGSPQPPAAFSASSNIVGPGSSTVNDIAVWNNTGGTQLKDVPFVTICGSNIFAAALVGCVPASGGGTANFLRADGTWNAPIGAVSSVFTRSGAVVAANGDYNTGQVTYSPVGTGGVATTAKAELDRTIWVNDYGAVCDGVTNDATAIQNALNRGMASGLPVKFSGNCAINSALSITSQVDFSGASSAGFQSAIIQNNVAVDIIDINTATGQAIYLHDFFMRYASAANATTAAIQVTSPSSENGGSKFERLTINGNVSIGFNFIRASTWAVTNSTIAARNQGFIIANQNVVDSGDSTISGNIIISGGAGFTGIVYNSSGGLRVINNKINGAANITNGFQMALAPGAVTADLFITGNSIEGISATGTGIALARAGTTGAFGTVVITGNELSGQVCVNVGTDPNGLWLNNLIVTGNNCLLQGTNPIAFSVDSTQGITMSSNFVQGSGSTNKVYSIGTTGPTSTNCVIGMTPHLAGTFSASTAGACSTVAPF